MTTHENMRFKSLKTKIKKKTSSTTRITIIIVRVEMKQKKNDRRARKLNVYLLLF